MKARRVFLVGERMNLSGARWPQWEDTIEAGEIERWLDFSVRVGCFGRKCTDARRKLEGVGVPLKGAMCANLLPPGACGEWDADVADRVGATWSSWIFEVLSGRRETGGGAPTARRVVCLGVRATTACLGYEADLLSTHELVRDAPGSLSGVAPESIMLLSLPHPSGLNRWWNDPSNWLEASEIVDAFLRLAPWEEQR